MVYFVAGPILILPDISLHSRDFYFLIAVSRFLRPVYTFYVVLNLNLVDTSETKISFLIYKNAVIFMLLVLVCAGIFMETENATNIEGFQADSVGKL